MSIQDAGGQFPHGQGTGLAKVTRVFGLLSSVVIVGGLAWWAYNLGSRDASTVPVIRAAEEEELRTRPEETGGQVADYQGNEVNEVIEGNSPELSNNVTLAPAAEGVDDVAPAEGAVIVSDDNAAAVEEGETPVPEGLRTADGLQDDGDFILAAGDLPTIPAPDRRPELLYIPPQDAMNPATREAQPVGAEGGEVAAADPVPTANEIVDGGASDAVEVVEDLTAPIEETPAEAPVVETAAAEPAPEPAVEPEPAPAVASGENATSDNLGPRLPSGTPVIQLGANARLEDTKAQWQSLRAKHSDILGDKSLYIEKTQVDGKTFFRLRVQGFSGNAATKAACEALLSRNVQCLAASAK